jgi:hypothetical protein
MPKATQRRPPAFSQDFIERIARTEPLKDGCVRPRKRASPKWPRKLFSINKILTEQEQKFRAAKRSSEVSVQLFCETMCILDLIDFYFEGIVFDPELDLPANMRRFRSYMRSMTRIHDLVVKIEMWIIENYERACENSIR